MSKRKGIPNDNGRRNPWCPVANFTHKERGRMKLQMNDTLHSQIRTGLTEYILQVQRLVI